MFSRSKSFSHPAAALALLLLFAGRMLHAANESIPVSRNEFEDLKKQLTAIQQENAELKVQAVPVKASAADKVLDAKYGPNANVTNKVGKLSISGLVQVWYYYIENDRHALFDDPGTTGVFDFNSASSNDSFRIRRTDLRFTADINEHLSASIMIDPAREATSFPSFPSNQGQWKRTANSLTGTTVVGVQTGVGAAPRFLQEAYILYKDVVPHHDIQVGQFKPPFGDEALRSAAELDFAERSAIAQLSDLRDMGAHVRGHWWDDRFQYWVGAFDAAGNYYGSAGQQQNRSDDNDDKDIVLRTIVRPLWKHDCWGSLELGASASFGYHGQAGSIDPTVPIGLNRERTWATRLSAHGSYLAGGFLKGLWLRGEWLRIHDRNAPSSVIDLLGNDINGNGVQDGVKPFSSQGWQASAGYRLGDGPCAKDCLPGWAQRLEVGFRYESYQNVQIADQFDPAKTDVYSTRVFTSGLTYYISGNSKVQANYNHIQNPDSARVGGAQVFHKVQNDSLLINFQVAF